MSAIDLACAARRDYVPHAGAMLHSVLAQSDGGVRVHFLHGRDLPRADRRRLEGLVAEGGGEISFLRVGRRQVRRLATRSTLPSSHWYRVFLPELLPHVDRLLYLDADVIALQPVAPLHGIDLQGNLLAAVTNVFEREYEHRAAELGLASTAEYFNSGVMVMDLEALRRERASQAVIEWARAHHDLLLWPEQDALNVVLGERRLGLPPRWNAMNSVLLFPWAEEVFGAAAVAEAREAPAIRHFEGPSINKPWHPDCERRDRELYTEHRRQTPWAH